MAPGLPNDGSGRCWSVVCATIPNGLARCRRTSTRQPRSRFSGSTICVNDRTGSLSDWIRLASDSHGSAIPAACVERISADGSRGLEPFSSSRVAGADGVGDLQLDARSRTSHEEAFASATPPCSQGRLRLRAYSQRSIAYRHRIVERYDGLVSILLPSGVYSRIQSKGFDSATNILGVSCEHRRRCSRLSALGSGLVLRDHAIVGTRATSPSSPSFS